MREALERAKALRWAGRPEDAALELRKALADVGDRCELLYLLWDCQFVLGDRAAAHETLLEAKGLAEGKMVARVAVAEASWLMSQGEYHAAMTLAGSVDTDDDAVRAYALSVRGVCEAFLGDVDLGTATLEDARTAAHRSGCVRELTRAVGNLTFVLGSSGRHERSARIGKEALTRLRIQGMAPTFSPIWLCLSVEVNEPGSMPAISGSVMFGFSSQFAMPVFTTVLETMAPKSRTGIFDADSTFVCDSSSTCCLRISTDGV